MLTVGQISLIAQALGGVPSRREGLQVGQGDGSQRGGQHKDRQNEDRQESQQEGPRHQTPQTKLGHVSDSQDFIPLTFAQRQGDEEREAGEIPLMREQMRRVGTLLQEKVAEE